MLGFLQTVQRLSSVCGSITLNIRLPDVATGVLQEESVCLFCCCFFKFIFAVSLSYLHTATWWQCPQKISTELQDSKI